MTLCFEMQVGTTGMTEAVLALTYDPAVLKLAPADITLGSTPSLGRGWQIHSVVDSDRGQIGIELYSTTAADITLGSVPGLGTGWQLISVIDQARGRIGIELHSTTALTATEGGSLVNIAFRLLPGQRSQPATGGVSPPWTALQLVSSAAVDGKQFNTQLDDAEGALVLSTGRDRLEVGAGVRAPSRLPVR
jgi:hypothetical protein